MPRKTPKAIRGKTPSHVRVRPEHVANDIREALDPTRASGKPRLWRDMSKAERDAITAAYKRR